MKKYYYNKNEILNVDLISSNVTHLIFGWKFNQCIGNSLSSLKITHLIFGYKFNQPLQSNSIPTSVTHITFGHRFNKIIKPDIIPSSVKCLTFSQNFNKKLNVDITTNIDIEINIHCKNSHLNNFLVVNLFAYGHNEKIDYSHVDIDAYSFGQEYNDYIDNNRVTKIKLINKSIYRSKIKSAKNTI